jgi:low affinity Fe/Cu permease
MAVKVSVPATRASIGVADWRDEGASMTRQQLPENLFERFAYRMTRWTGSTPTFLGALGIVLVWAALGPVFHYSDTWQLVINTGTTIVTFLMVFLIQRTQNKDSLAMQLKLNELIAIMKGASNQLLNAEDLDEEELRILHEHYGRLAALAEKERSLGESHSIAEADERHQEKIAGAPRRSRKPPQ